MRVGLEGIELKKNFVTHSCLHSEKGRPCGQFW